MRGTHMHSACFMIHTIAPQVSQRARSASPSLRKEYRAPSPRPRSANFVPRYKSIRDVHVTVGLQTLSLSNQVTSPLEFSNPLQFLGFAFRVHLTASFSFPSFLSTSLRPSPSSSLSLNHPHFLAHLISRTLTLPPSFHPWSQTVHHQPRGPRRPARSQDPIPAKQLHQESRRVHVAAKAH